MSKLYKKYILLKIDNPNKIYLFQCGLFYIFIDDDAKIMSNLLNLKLTNLNSIIVKCGFPIKSSKKYFNILQNTNYIVQIIPSNHDGTPINIDNYISFQEFSTIINDFIKINLEHLSVKEAFELLEDLQNKLKDFIIKYNNEKKI